MQINATINVDSFLRAMNGGRSLALDRCEKALNETINIFYGKIVRDTPVGNPDLWKWPAPKDYTPGTLKASWKLSFGFGGSYAIDLKNKYGNKTAHIINDQPYAQRVEYGWSTQAPTGMVRINILSLPSILNKQINKYRF